MHVGVCGTAVKDCPHWFHAHRVFLLHIEVQRCFARCVVSPEREIKEMYCHEMCEARYPFIRT
jgi:hypothetical protein